MKNALYICDHCGKESNINPELIDNSDEYVQSNLGWVLDSYNAFCSESCRKRHNEKIKITRLAMKLDKMQMTICGIKTLLKVNTSKNNKTLYSKISNNMRELETIVADTRCELRQ